MLRGMFKHKRWLPWLRRAPWIALAVLVPGAYIVGVWSTCDDCGWNTNMFGAIGTWVGGIGTILALIFAGLQVTGDLEARAEERAQRSRDEQDEFQAAYQAAQLIRIDVAVNQFIGPTPMGGYVGVANGTNEIPIYKLEVESPMIGESQSIQVKPGHSFTMGFQFAEPPVSDINVWRLEQLSQSSISYDLGPHRWSRIGSDPAERVGPAAGGAA